MTKSVFGFLTRFDTNQAIQTQKMAREISDYGSGGTVLSKQKQKR